MQAPSTQPGQYPYAVHGQQPQFYVVAPGTVPAGVAQGYAVPYPVQGMPVSTGQAGVQQVAGAPQVAIPAQYGGRMPVSAAAAYQAAAGQSQMGPDGAGMEMGGGYQDLAGMQAQPYATGPPTMVAASGARPVYTMSAPPRPPQGQRYAAMPATTPMGGRYVAQPGVAPAQPAMYPTPQGGYVYAAGPPPPMRPKGGYPQGGLGMSPGDVGAGYPAGYTVNYQFLPTLPQQPQQQQQHQQQQFHLQQFQQQEAGPSDVDDTPITNIYIRGLASSVTDDQLHEMCKGFGQIVSSKAIIDIRTNECKGYGFVMYETQDEAKLAMSELAKQGLQVSFAKESFSARLKNLQDSGSTNVYLSNIPMSLTEEGLTELFSPMVVVSQKILRDNHGISRGVGFIRFDTREDAVAAIERFHGITLPGGTAPLQVRFSDSPAQKKLKIQVAAKRKVMKPGPPAYAMRRRSEVEEQYVYASEYYQMQGGMAVPAYPQMAVAMPPEMVAGGPMPVYFPVMPIPQMTPVIPVRTSPPNGRENRPPSSSSGTPPELSESGQLRVDPRGGTLRVPRSPSDLGNSAEISAASEDGAFEFGSAGDIDELTQRVNSLMYENSIGSDETVEGPSKGKETRKEEVFESGEAVESKPAQ